MGVTYNSLLLERFFFPSLNFSLSFFYFPSLSLFPTFSLFFMCSLFFLFFSFIFEKVFSFSHFVSKNQGALVKIYLEDVYDIFFIINGLCISLLHTQYTFLYIFLLHCSNFIKMCARRYVQIMTYFFC